VSAREPLTVRDLARLAGIAAEAADRHAQLAAADALVQRTIGHPLFTVMPVREAAHEVECLYGTNPGAYPVGGRRRKRDTPWSRVVLVDHERARPEVPSWT
jgi:hypothetical protein